MRDTVKILHADVVFEEVKLQLAEGHKAKLRISGMSMWPFLCHGRDFVVLSSVEPEQIRKGNIVLLKRADGSYLIHRVTGLNGENIQTTGDGKLERDGWFPKKDVIAVADSIIRKDKEIRCNCFPWKQIMGLWTACFPIRTILLKVLYWISRQKMSVKK